MLAAVLVEGGSFDVREADDPAPGPGQLLLRVTGCGLCGSDLKARGVMPAGTVMGHEFGGEVIAAGSGTAGWETGTYAAVLPVHSCGSCRWCGSGEVVHCAEAQQLGLGGGPGGFAELAVVDASSVFALPASIDPRHAPLVEPYAVGLHCIDAAAVGAGDAVLVIGAGTVGLTTTAWAAARGATRITVVDPSEQRRTAASSFGATDSIGAIADAEPNAYDVVVECVGKPGLLDGCTAAGRPRGRIVVAGVCVEPDPYLPIIPLLKELNIRFAVYYTPAEFRTVITAFVDGTLDPGLLVGRTMPLASIDEAFEVFTAGTVVGKLLVEPSAGPRLR
jgi:(R,R)-butanediol dehydrogenase/meso-butanediol dehydrogenase/diacetyl reductase